MSYDSPERPEPNASIAYVLADASANPLYANHAATAILLWPRPPGDWTDSRAQLAERVRSILGLSAGGDVCWPSSEVFLSGRRRYTCRCTRLESQRPGSDEPTWVLLLGREPFDPAAIFEVSRLFHFTTREREVVQHLINGLTTKEIAQRMHISVSTVKAFIRLVMCKMRVTTRSGIVGKVFASHEAA